MNNYIIAYLIVINLTSFILFALDKKRSLRRKWRIPESTLIFVSLMGGAVGSLLGMKLFKHKTKKLKFTILVPISLIINILLIILYIKKG